MEEKRVNKSLCGTWEIRRQGRSERSRKESGVYLQTPEEENIESGGFLN